MKFRSIALLLSFLLITVAAFGQTETKDETALKSLVKKMTDAQLAYDPGTLDQIFTADYIEISPVGEFDPRDKVLGFYKPELKTDSDKMSKTLDVTDFSIRNYGKFAIVVVKLSYTIIVDGKPTPPRSLRATFVCKPEKGAWKIASAQYTGIRPPQQQPPKSQ